MDQELRKVASDVPGVLLAAAEHLTKLANDNVALEQRAESAEHQVACYKLARRMEERGLQQELTFDEKVAALQQLPVAKIATMEQAVELSAGGFSLGTVAEDSKTASPNGVENPEALESFINSGAAYGA